MTTTEESDWEASGPGIRSRSEPPLPGPEPPLIPNFTGLAAPVRRTLSPPIAQNRGNETVTPRASTGLFHQTFAVPAPTPPENVVLVAATAQPGPSVASPAKDLETQERMAGPDLTLTQMATSQDLDATPSQIAFMARVSGRGSSSSSSSRGESRLGGGRGSRGGRPPKIKIEPPHEDGDPITALPRKANKGGRPRGSRAGQSSASSTKGAVNRGGRPRGSRVGMSASAGRGGFGRIDGGGMKRKRKSGGGGGEEGDGDDDGGSSDSSEEITSLPTQSRSGRRITQVVTPIPIEPEVDSSLKPPKPPSFATPSDFTSSGQKPAKRKRVTLSAVCKNCGRGHSPQSNQIVFCDGCNTPWHQYCHDRPITPTVIQEEEKEWHCGDCQVHAEEANFMVGRIPPAEGMGLAEKRRALEAMDRAELVALLLRASTLYPDFPILKPPPPPETWTAATTTTTTTAITTTAAAATLQAPVANKETEYEYYDEPLPYPRAGNGVRLPAEEEDVELLIDENINTYSHSWFRDNKWIGALADVATDSKIFRPASFAIEIGA